MKQLKLLLIGIMLTCSTAFGQQLMISNASQIGSWNGTEWEWDEWIYAELKFVLNQNTIIVNDEANSVYVTYGDPEYIEGSYFWEAFDEKNKLCSFGLTQYETNNLIIIMYGKDNVCFKYAIRNL